MQARYCPVLEVFGPLRTALVVISVVELCLAPLALGEMVLTGWGVFCGAIVPATTVMTVFGLLLDILMSYVFTAEQTAPVRDRYAVIRRVEIGLLGGLLLIWAPVFAYRLGYIQW
jgi:hypothetical protein